jgi:predicted enzyme related to lactoylglutathione lyase
MTEKATTQFDLVTIDTPHTDALAAFWSAVMDLVETEREDGDRWIVLSDRHAIRRLGFQRGPHRPGGTHLDLVCPIDDFDREAQRLRGLGARDTRPARTEPYGRIANFVDPDGNAFDLCAYS